MSKSLVITFAGLHGSGRTTHAKRVAKEFNLRYVSTGMLFRKRAEELGVSLEEMNRIAERDELFDNYLDERAKEESKKKGVVIDATLSGWIAEDPDLRIFLSCPFSERVRRIAKRENREPKEVEEETKVREDSERLRFEKFYGVDLDNLGIYDLVLNTSIYDIEGAARIIKKAVEEYIRSR